MAFRLRIETDNATFADDPADEIVRILRELANFIEADLIPGRMTVSLRDINGNRVGAATYTRPRGAKGA